MKTKYQIFVSSTYEDLKAERDLVIKAILEMGHIPVGMEMFSAGDEQQWALIKRLIDDCDYYVVILAHRYGTMDDGIGYTEKEYDYAVSKGIPALGFVLAENVNWPANFIDKDALKIEKLESFKAKVKSKIISFWNNREDLYGKVSIALSKQFTMNPGVGWVRSGETVGPEVITEISRLSKENSELRQKIEEYKSKLREQESSKKLKLLESLIDNKITLSYFYKNGTDWEDAKKVSYYKIFDWLAPELMIEKSTEDIGHFIAMMTNGEKASEFRNVWPVPSNLVNWCLSDLAVLGLIQPSIKKRSVKDEKKYWMLTPLGMEINKTIRLSRINSNLKKDKSKNVNSDDGGEKDSASTTEKD